MEYCIACEDKVEAKYTVNCGGIIMKVCYFHYKQYKEEEMVLKQINTNTYGIDNSNNESIDNNFD